MGTHVSLKIEGEERSWEGDLVDCALPALLNDALNEPNRFVLFKGRGSIPRWINKRFIVSVTPMDALQKSD